MFNIFRKLEPLVKDVNAKNKSNNKIKNYNTQGFDTIQSTKRLNGNLAKHCESCIKRHIASN
jgi:hypothetical protein